MATETIVAGSQSLFQGGRLNSPDQQGDKSYLSYRTLVVGGDVYEFQFPTGGQAALTFGTPLSMFVDNSNNDYEMSVSIVGTGQTFIIPANTSGTYAIDAVPGSAVQVVSSGNSTDKVNFIFYNYQRTPFVWYAYGTGVQVTSIPNGADVALGNTSDAPATNPALPGTLISTAKGILKILQDGPILVSGSDGISELVLKTDGAGRLEVIGSASGGTVFGANADGTPPTQAPVLTAGWDGTNVQTLSTNAAGALNTVISGGPIAVTQSGSWIVDVSDTTFGATQSGAWNITNISGTISLPTGAATEASLAKLTVAQGAAIGANTGALSFGSVTTAEPAYTTATLNALSLSVTGRLRTETKQAGAPTGTSANVASSVSNVTLLASNTNARARTIYNDSASATLYAKLGTTASLTSFTVAISAGGYYEVPGNYTGIIDGIWSAAVGSARVTEIT